jgi:hypothetical protein
MFLLAILSYVLLSIGLFVTAIIFIPYNYYVAGENLDLPQLQGTVSWLFGGIKISFNRQSQQNKEIILTIFGLKKKVRSRPKLKRSENEKSGQNRKRFNFIKYMKRDIIENSISSLVKIVKYCLPKTLSVDTRIGFNNPFYTGLLSAFTNQSSVWFKKYDINIQLVFEEEIIKGRFLIGGQIWLPYLILVMIGFLITKPIRNIFISQLKTKIKGGLHYVG